MNKLENQTKFEELKETILKQKDKEINEEMLRILNDIEIDYNRLKKSTDMKIHVLEIEKQIILDNYIAKDNDVNHLYNKLNSQGFRKWKLYKILRAIKRKIIK